MKKKVFKYSELHFSGGTFYKIHTLVTILKALCKPTKFMWVWYAIKNCILYYFIIPPEPGLPHNWLKINARKRFSFNSCDYFYLLRFPEIRFQLFNEDQKFVKSQRYKILTWIKNSFGPTVQHLVCLAPTQPYVCKAQSCEEFSSHNLLIW